MPAGASLIAVHLLAFLLEIALLITCIMSFLNAREAEISKVNVLSSAYEVTNRLGEASFMQLEYFLNQDNSIFQIWNPLELTTTAGMFSRLSYDLFDITQK